LVTAILILSCSLSRKSTWYWRRQTFSSQHSKSGQIHGFQPSCSMQIRVLERLQRPYFKHERITMVRIP